MDSMIARGCCFEKQLEISSDNNDRWENYFDQCSKLDSFNWLREISTDFDMPDVVEVRFKNTRKEYYKNVNGLRLKRGDFIAVEASPGHDIGIIAFGVGIWGVAVVLAVIVLFTFSPTRKFFGKKGGGA